MTDETDKTAPHDPRRRALLTGGLAAGAALAACGPGAAQTDGAAAGAGDPAILEPRPWRTTPGPGVRSRVYGLPSPHESHVGRQNVPWLTADTLSSVSFTPIHALEGTITPNGLCFERHHSGIAEIDPAQHRLMVNGLVRTPLVFTMDELRRFPRTSRIHFLECAANSGMEWRGPQLNGAQFTHGMIHNVEYTGVPLRLILEEAGLKGGASWILAEGADAAGMTRSIPLEKALDDCLVAFAQNGEALRPEQGYPLRLVVPGWEGNMWIKWLRRIEVGDRPWMHREETSKYTDLMPDGTSRQFTFVMDAKSVITAPSPQVPVTHGPGPLMVTGLAWSGRGHVAAVDVSLDGGINWHRAQLEGTGGPRALHRFRYVFDWDGRPLLLQSRATDSTGYVQPTKDALRRIRGLNSAYHNNGIQTWAVSSEGEVENVEVS